MYYFLAFLFIQVSARASFFSFYDINYLIIDVLFIWVGLETGRFRESDFRIFFHFATIYVAFVTIRFMFFNNIDVQYYVNDIEYCVKYVFLSFLFCAFFKEKALYYLTKIIIHLAIISMPFYALQLLSADSVMALGRFIGLPPKFGLIEYTNFLVFTFDRLHLFRNAGFAWEPGAYGCFLNMALLFQFLMNGFVFDRNAKILAVAIITTLSTTSYLAFVIILLMRYRANGGRITTLLVCFFPIGLLAALKLPFLLDKIIYTYNADREQLSQLEYVRAYYTTYGGQIPLNRFASFLYITDLYGTKLIWGICNKYKEIGTALLNTNISNGLIDFAAKFGLIGVVFVVHRFILLLKSFLLSNELIAYAVLVLLILSFGEPMLILQTSLAILFLYKYIKPSVSNPSSTAVPPGKGLLSTSDI